MENLIIVGHVLVAVIIIGLILLQQGKGAEVGATFGSGSSQTLFGASGSGNFFAKATAVIATIFFVSSFSLAVIAKQNANIGDDSSPALKEITADVNAVEALDDLPVMEEVEVAADDLPDVSVEDSAPADAGDVPEAPEG